MFERLGSIFTWIRWIMVIFFVILLFMLGKNLYPVLTDCWTCKIFASFYDAFSRISYHTFDYFRDQTIPVISVCLALWIAYETFKALDPALSLYGEDHKIDPEFFKKIYKKIFLAVAVMGLFLFNSPRNVFSNTLEITLDFASGVSREFIRKKTSPDLIPEECKIYDEDIRYNENMVLSENTKENMICLLKEVQGVRASHMDLGIALFENGMVPIITTIGVYIGTRVGLMLGGAGLKKYASKVDGFFGNIGNWFKNKFKRNSDDIIENIADNVTKPSNSKKIGQALQDTSGGVAFLATLGAIISNEDVVMGLTGIAIIIGFFIINMFFSFIIIEQMLFLGISIILMPILAACYIFEQTRNFATTSLKQTFDSAVGLIIFSIALVITVEINDWIFGGMFSQDNMENVISTTDAIALLRSGDPEKIALFNETVGGSIYFIYAIFAIAINALILKEAKSTFAGWFTGKISDSSLIKPLLNIGKSTFALTKSVVREMKDYRKISDVSLKDKSAYLDLKVKEAKKRRDAKKAEKKFNENKEEGGSNEN